VGLSIAVITCGTTAAAMPTFWLQLRAHLEPVAGTTAAGRFNGVLAKSGVASGKTALPRYTGVWRLTWTFTLPSLGGSTTAWLRLPAQKGAAAVARVLCTHCAARAKGTMTLTSSQALRIAGSHSVVVVRTSSARLRGTVKVFAHIPVAMTR
jgi:hypothetical protein